MNKTSAQKINNLIFGLVLGMTFLIPTFFLTITGEYFEFNKLYFFVSTTALLAFFWCAKMFAEKKFYLAKSPMDLPFLLVLVAYTLSTVSSLDKTASLFGSYGRWFPGLFGFVALYFFYYIVTTNIDSAKKIRTILYTLAGATAVPSFLGLINYAGLTIPFMNLINQKGFLLTGASSALATTALVGSVLCALLVVNIKSPVKKLLFVTGFMINFVTLAVIGGWIFLLVSLAVIMLGLFNLPAQTLEKSKAYIFPTLGAVLAFVALYFVVPQTKNMLQRDYPKEILPSVRESWIISSTTLRDFPIFGSGVSTFYLNYPRYRTIDQNTTPTWNLAFDKPASEVLNIISTMGIFGLVAYGLLIATAISFIAKTTKVNDAYKGLSVIISAGVLTSLLCLILTYASFQSTFIMIILLAILTAEAVINTNKSWAKISSLSLESKSQSEGDVLIGSQMLYRKEVFHYIIALPIVALAVFGMYQVYLQYAPEYFMQRSVLSASTGNINQAYDYQVKAISVNPNRSYYHRVYTNTNLALAQAMATKENLTDEEKTTAQNLLAQSLTNIKFASENLNPLDSANWVMRAQVYKFLVPLAKDADQFAIQSYNTAIQLDPTNPALRIELGGIYYSKEDYLSAGNLFKQAVNLKPDYANARYNLAQALIKLKAFSDAKTELEAVQKLIDAESKDYELVANDIRMVDAELAKVAGAQTEAKPSVEELAKTGKNQDQAIPQEPLTKPEDQLQPQETVQK